MNKNTYLLIIIVLLAFLLRFLFLGTNPPSLTWDETAWGYNAYSLGIDGKDEFGKFLPITYLESFGDYKPPVYAYLDIIPIKLFGLNEFGTRFPSAFFGTFTVLLTFFLVKEIFGNKKVGLALLSSFILAISPWHIMLSRAAFEANVANFFIVLGVYLFLKSLKKPPLLLLSAISFVLSLYTFNSARIVAPLLVVILFVVFYKKLITNMKALILSTLIGIVLVMPLLLFMRTPQSKLRFNEVNIFSDITIINRTNTEIKNDGNNVLSKIIHNRRFTYGVEYLRHYLDNLSPSFLFIKGDGNPKFSIQDVGQMYLWEIPFFIAGIFLLFRLKYRYWWLVPLWMILGIIPAGFARETPHALRIESSLPTFQIFTAMGLYGFIKFIRRKKIWISIISAVILLNFIYFAQNYFIHYRNEFSGEWQYGYKESIDYVSGVMDNYDNVYITEALGRPYIYYLFYTKYPPQKFRDEALIYRETMGFVHVNSYAKFHFSDKISQIREKNSLYISTPAEKPQNGQILKEFKLLNGQTALIAYTL